MDFFFYLIGNSILTFYHIYKNGKIEVWETFEERGDLHAL